MNLIRDNRHILDALSQEVFGSSSRWQKLVNKGYTELVTRTATRVVPGKDGEEDKTEEFQTPVFHGNRGYQYIRKYHTPESIEQVMLELLDQKRVFQEAQFKLQEEKRLKEEAELLAKQAQSLAGGSAT